MQGETPTPNQTRNGVYPAQQQSQPHLQTPWNFGLMQFTSANGTPNVAMPTIFPFFPQQQQQQQHDSQPVMFFPGGGTTTDGNNGANSSLLPQQQQFLQNQLFWQAQQPVALQAQHLQQVHQLQQSQAAQKHAPQQQQQQQQQAVVPAVQSTEKKEKTAKLKIPKKVPLETRLKELTDSRGAIEKPDYALALIQIMGEEKISQKVKNAILNSLHVTNKNCLDKFMELSGVNILKTWLEEASNNNKVKIIQQLLNVLAKLPMTVPYLQSSQIGKTLKNLLKNQSNDQVKSKMESLLKQWKRLAERRGSEEMKQQKQQAKVKSIDGSSDGGGIFSALSGSSIPKKSNSLTIPKLSARADASAKKENTSQRQNQAKSTNNASIQRQEDNVKRPPHMSQPNGTPPLKRKVMDDMQTDDATPTKRPKLTSPPKKRRVTWADKLEHIKIFEKEIPYEESQMDQLKRHQQQQQQQQSHQPNQDYLTEKQFFTQQREEKRKRLEQMNATTQWYQPLLIANLKYLVERGFESEEAAIRRAEHMSRPRVVYQQPQDIPDTPASPTSVGENVKNILDPNVLNTLYSVLSSTGSNTAATITPQMPINHHYMSNNNPNSSTNSSGNSSGIQIPPQLTQNLAAALATINNRNAANTATTQSSSSAATLTRASKAIRCKFYGSKVGCRNGASCPFYHHGIDPIPPGGVKEFDPEIAKQIQEGRAQKLHGGRPILPMQPVHHQQQQPLQQPPQNPNPYSAAANNNNNSNYRQPNHSRGGSYSR